MAADIYTFKKSQRYRIFEVSQTLRLRKAIKNTNTPLIKKNNRNEQYQLMQQLNDRMFNRAKGIGGTEAGPRDWRTRDL